MECVKCGNEGTEEDMLLCTDCGDLFCSDDCAEDVPCPNHAEGIHSSN